jgi:hypothetical protein
MKITKLTVPNTGNGKRATCTDYTKVAETFDETSAQISNLVYKCWFSRYPCCQYLIYDNGSEFKLHFCALCATYGIKRKLTSIKNPTANALHEHTHAVFTNMLCTAELEMAKLVNASDIDIFLSDAAWASHSNHHTVLKASSGAAIFGQDMLFGIPFIVDWKKIGEHRKQLTDLNTARENKGRIDYVVRKLYGMMVYSAKQNPDGRKTPGQVQQSIQMEESQFNIETN